MKISLFRGNIKNISTTETIDSWDDFCDLVGKPTIGGKDGDYFVRGYCTPTRDDKNMQSIDLIIIDGDQLISDGSTCCPPEPVHAVLKTNNITHIIYSSFSNSPDKNIYKWRLCIPCDELINKNSTSRGAREIISCLNANGLMVKNSSESSTISQGWFLPRIQTPDDADFFYSAFHDGETYKLGKFNAYETKIEEKYTQKTKFNWDVALEGLTSGTAHEKLTEIAGWCVRTMGADWADSQLVEFMAALTKNYLTEPTKKERVLSNDCKEIKDIVKSFRLKEKQNTTVIGWETSIITGDQLQSKVYPPIQWAVDGIIPEGLTILAGDPKVGKSTLAVDICSAVASGVNCLGNVPCVSGGAVYISLEDPERRVKDRIEKQHDLWPNTFRLITAIGIISIDPMIEQIKKIYQTFPDTRVIVVDTMGTVLPPKPQNQADYLYYYQVLPDFQRWALTNHVALIMITHKNKDKAGQNDNKFASIMGSQGIQAVADTLILLSKNYEKEKIASTDFTLPDGYLDIKGRDMGETTHMLEWNAATQCYNMMIERKPPETGNVNFLLILKSLEEKQLTPKEIGEKTLLNKSSIKVYLRRMLAKGLLINTDGLYSLPNVEYKKSDQNTRW
jgi:hypothetical protein